MDLADAAARVREEQSRPSSTAEFEKIFDRIRGATGVRTQVEIADVLGIRQSSISDAKRRGSVPADWYMKLFENHGLNPDWLKYGKGPMYLKDGEVYGAFEGPDAVQQALMFARPQSREDTEVTITPVYSSGADVEKLAEGVAEPEYRMALPKSLAPEHVQVLKAQDSGMHPAIPRGAIIGVDRSSKGVAPGEIHALVMPHIGIMLRRVLVDSEGEGFMLNPDNDAHVPTRCSRENLQVYGRIVWVLQHV